MSRSQGRRSFQKKRALLGHDALWGVMATGTWRTSRRMTAVRSIQLRCTTSISWAVMNSRRAWYDARTARRSTIWLRSNSGGRDSSPRNRAVFLDWGPLCTR